MTSLESKYSSNLTANPVRGFDPSSIVSTRTTRPRAFTRRFCGGSLNETFTTWPIFKKKVLSKKTPLTDRSRDGSMASKERFAPSPTVRWTFTETPARGKRRRVVGRAVTGALAAMAGEYGTRAAKSEKLRVPRFPPAGAPNTDPAIHGARPHGRRHPRRRNRVPRDRAAARARAGRLDGAARRAPRRAPLPRHPGLGAGRLRLPPLRPRRVRPQGHRRGRGGAEGHPRGPHRVQGGGRPLRQGARHLPRLGVRPGLGRARRPGG